MKGSWRLCSLDSFLKACSSRPSFPCPHLPLPLLAELASLFADISISP